MNKHEYAAEAGRAIPSLGISGAVILGLTVSDWVLVLTLVYTLLSIFFLLRREYRKYREEQACRKQRPTTSANSTERLPEP